jgi:hypothetical protein
VLGRPDIIADVRFSTRTRRVVNRPVMPSACANASICDGHRSLEVGHVKCGALQSLEQISCCELSAGESPIAKRHRDQSPAIKFHNRLKQIPCRFHGCGHDDHGYVKIVDEKLKTASDIRHSRPHFTSRRAYSTFCSAVSNRGRTGGPIGRADRLAVDIHRQNWIKGLDVQPLCTRDNWLQRVVRCIA